MEFRLIEPTNLMQLYGFIADPNKPLWKNVDEYFERMDPRTYYFGRPTNMACHNYCTSSEAPVGIECLLGLGPKFCVTKPKLPPTAKTMERLRRDVRWKYIFRGQPDDDDNYIPELYINSETKPDAASDEIEAGLDRFESALETERTRRNRNICPNLTPMQQGLIKRLENNEIHKVISADKGMGFCILNTDHLTERGCSEHLSNTSVYQRLSRGMAETFVKGAERIMQEFMGEYKDSIRPAELTYLRRGLHQRSGKMARFYMTIKVHKNPYKFRPIVSTCGTAISCLSSWLDYKLQKLRRFIGTYIRDSDDFREQLKQFGPLSCNAFHLTADANSMYTNIDTEHALQVLRWFLEELDAEGNLPPDYDIDMLLDAARIVMTWNIFEFGDCCFRQLIGTAMGTPVACIWATIYFWYYEKTVLIPKYGTKIPFFRRFIDDMYAIVLIGGQTGLTASEWAEFKEDLDDFGLLTWEIEEPSHSVNFLDLTIEIRDGHFFTKTYQKPTNLYQYIPPSSAHPPGMIKHATAVLSPK